MKTTLDATQSGRGLDASLARERNEEREARDPLWTLVVSHALVERLPLPRPATVEASEAAPDVERAGSTPPSGAPAPDDALGADDVTSRANGRLGGRGSASNDPRVLCAEVSDERLGRLALRVVRGQNGLDIVIGVADSHVKALITAEQSALMKSLKDAGLAVVSLQIGAPTPTATASRAGTTLAVKSQGPERQGVESPAAKRPRAAASFRQPAARWRGYPGSLEEEDDDGGVDFTA